MVFGCSISSPRNEIPYKKRKSRASLKCSTSGERNEVENPPDKENKELRADFQDFSDSLSLSSVNYSEKKNPEILTLDERFQDATNRQKNLDPLLDYFHLDIYERTRGGCAVFIPNPYCECAHCSKLRDQITKLQKNVERLRSKEQFIRL